MLKILAYVAGALAVAILAILGYAATLPDSFRIARSTNIKAPAEKIFPLIDDLHGFNTWNPFLKKDPATRVTYSGPASGTGARNAWDGSGQTGAGEMEIVSSSPSSNVTLKLHIIRPFETVNQVVFTLEPKGGTTTVTWAMTGQNAFIGKVIGVFMNVDRMVGGDFENGLADLKALAEK